MAPKVSLASELADIAAVLEGIEVQAEDLAHGEVAATRDLHVLAATVGMVRARLLLLRKVVIGATDAALVLDRRSRVDSVHEGDDPDVLLPTLPKKR